MRRAGVVGATVVAIALCVAAPALAAPSVTVTAHLAVAPPSPGCLVRNAPPSVGLTELSRTASGRLLDLRVRSAAMQGVQPVYVLLPTHYDPGTRYPVLYLLHGALDDYTSYPRNGVASIIGDLPVIVVMPDDGKDGSYSDWYGTVPGTLDPIPSWETYHLKELVPFVDATFPTIADRSGRFIAGISSGGSGTMKYVAANPGMFGAAGSISGAVDINLSYPSYPLISEALWGITLLPGYGPAGHCTWGDPFTQRVVWNDNDPTFLAGNLAGTPLFLSCGTGQPGPYDGSQAYTDPTEYEVWSMNQEFVKALDAAGIAHDDDFYGPGTHTWPYFGRELSRFVAWLAPRLTTAPAIPAPPRFSVRSARPAFDAWGWHFATDREVREFLYLRDVSVSGFIATGSGDLDVSTAPLYAAGRHYAITVSGLAPVDAAAGADGRLHLHVALGPSHRTQQYSFAPDDTASWVSRVVTITEAGP